MKSYDTEPRDNMAVESSPEDSEVKENQAVTKNIEKDSDVAKPGVSVPEVVSKEAEIDEHLQLVLTSDEQIADEEGEVDRQSGTYTSVRPVPADMDEEDEDSEDAQPQRRIFSLPTRGQLLEWLPFWGIILLAAILRFWGLGDKPLHHDESLHAYYSLQLMKNDLQNWFSCFNGTNAGCYRYDPLLHGPFQFHAIALMYQISQWLHAPDNGVNTTTVRLAAATLGTAVVGLPIFCVII